MSVSCGGVSSLLLHPLFIPNWHWRYIFAWSRLLESVIKCRRDLKKRNTRWLCCSVAPPAVVTGISSLVKYPREALSHFLTLLFVVYVLCLMKDGSVRMLRNEGVRASHWSTFMHSLGLYVVAFHQRVGVLYTFRGKVSASLGRESSLITHGLISGSSLLHCPSCGPPRMRDLVFLSRYSARRPCFLKYKTLFSSLPEDIEQVLQRVVGRLRCETDNS